MVQRKHSLPLEPKYTRPRVKTGHSSTAEGHPVRSRHPYYPKDDPKDQWPAGELLLGPMAYEDAEAGLLDKDQPCEPFADTICYPLDLFDRVFTGGTYSSGDAWSQEFYSAISSGDSNCYEQDDDTPFTLSVETSLSSRQVVSTLGTQSHGWTGNPGCGCGGLDFTFTGWKERTLWWKFTVPAHPASGAGLLVGPITFVAAMELAGGTVGLDNGGLVIVKTGEPTFHRDGTVVGTLPSNVASTILIPYSLIPEEGGEFWVGVIPNWTAALGSYACGFRWPWMDGQGNSGQGILDTYDLAAVWATWDGDADDWGRALSDDDSGAWWEGNLPWVVTGSGGTWGLDGTSFYLTASTNNQVTATMEGSSTYNPDDSYDEAIGEPWTDPKGIRMKMRFRLTTAGSLTEAGYRYITVEWHDGYRLNSITAHLGDTDYAQGVSVTAEGSEDYAEKDIVEDYWHWLTLDTRNPEYLRGKMWQEGSSFGSDEPPVPDVEVGLDDDSGDPSGGDYLRITISAGNETGAAQKVEISGIWFCGGGEDCEWVSERLGEGDGETMTYYSSMAFKEGSMWFFIDGLHTRVVEDDLNAGSFRTVDGLAAADGAVLVARYRVDGNPDGD